MRRPHFDSLITCSVEPPADSPTAGKIQAVNSILVDNRQFKVAAKGRAVSIALLDICF
jgi:hypothetical protein